MRLIRTFVFYATEIYITAIGELRFMLDFACKRFDFRDIIKCGLGLTRAEMEVFHFFTRYPGKEMTAAQVSKKTKLNLTTIQKAVKKLNAKAVLLRTQKNLGSGGYLFLYKCNSRKAIREILKGNIRKWALSVDRAIDAW